MKLLPHMDFELKTSLKEPQIMCVLSAHIMNIYDDSRMPGGTEKAFFGTVWKGAFEVRPMFVRYIRNDFVPVIRGSVEERERGSVVHIQMRMNTGVSVVTLCIWGFLALSLCLYAIALFTDVRGFEFSPSDLMLTVLAMAFWIALPCIGFYLPARNARRFLLGILGGRID